MQPVEYEEASKLATALSKVLDDIAHKFGNPRDTSTPVGWKLLDEVIRVWERYYPHEVEAWLLDRSDDLVNERSLHQHVKGGTSNPVTYPPTLFHLIRVMLPDVKLTDKTFQHQLVTRYPLFKSTNYSV